MEIVDYKCEYFILRLVGSNRQLWDTRKTFKAVKKTAGSCDWFIYLSQSVDAKGSNPLDPDRKLYYAKKMFPSYAKH